VASLADEMETQVTKHLAGCEFCVAEMHLLTLHAPLAPVSYEQSKMPAPLQYLAESLLAGSLLRIESFAETIYEKERLTVTQ
jgi:hypothetical protein